MAVRWRKSSYCTDNACVEVALTADQALIRHSEDPSGPHLAIGKDAWRQFIGDLKRGEFTRDPEPS